MCEKVKVKKVLDFVEFCFWCGIYGLSKCDSDWSSVVIIVARNHCSVIFRLKLA